MRPELFQVALRRRLQIQLCLGMSRCPARHCGRRLDRAGHHLAACPCTGLLQRCAKPLEWSWQVVLRARVVPQQLMRNMDVAVRATGGRQLDVVAYGLPVHGGLPLCGDATLVSPLDCTGWPKYGADRDDGAALAAARRRKCHRYPELANSERGVLVVLGCEVGGRWADEAWSLLQQLAFSKCHSAPALLRRSARLAWLRRWSCMVAVAAQSAFASKLVMPCALAASAPDGFEPELAQVFDEDRSLQSPAVSRQPPGVEQLHLRRECAPAPEISATGL